MFQIESFHLKSNQQNGSNRDLNPNRDWDLPITDRQPLTMMYSLCDHVLEQMDRAKYLGITVTHDLDWTPHIQSVCNKSSSTLAFLHRNLKLP